MTNNQESRFPAGGRGSTEPLVSVVVPAWNEEAYVGQCIESVLAQTHTNWDLTIVNNGSTDRTSAIAGHYAETDPRIRVVDNERFLPVIANHNEAFRQISPASAYCKVVGADDRLLPECLASMVSVAEGNPRVAIVGSYGIEDGKVVFDGIAPTETVVSGREVCRRFLLGGPYVFGAPTNVLYRSDIVRSRHDFYNERNLHADMEVCFEFLQWYDFGFAHRVLSFQRFREGSNTSYARSLNTYLCAHLHVLRNYGSAYLSESEEQGVRRRMLGDYHGFLFDQLCKGRGDDFWAYHREKLADLGYRLTKPKLCMAILVSTLHQLRNEPAATLKAIVRRLSAPGRMSAD
jgi:glycosyltransferase involved in cell wall biosynthesis